MNRDLVDQLDAYFSQVDERQGPVTPDQVADLMDTVHVLPHAPAPAQRPRVWVAAAAAAAVLVAIGIVPLLVGSQDSETSPATESPVATTPTTRPASTPTTGPPVATTDEVTARGQGLPYDPAIHDLCKWFESAEITEIVSDAYEAAGATVLPDSFGAGYPSTYPPFTCSWATEDTDIGSADWDGTGNYYLRVSMDTLRYPSTDPVLGTLSGGEVSVMEETDSLTIKEEIDDSYEPPDTLSDGLSLVGARVRDGAAWTPPGSPARWLFIDQIVQVEGRPEVHLSISVIADPPVEFASGSRAHRLVDVGLIVADTLLQRLNWLPSPTSAAVIPATTAALTTDATAPSPIQGTTKVDAPAVADEGNIIVGPDGTEWVSLAGTLRSYGVENKVIEPPELAARKPYIGPIAVTEDGDVWVSGFSAWLFPDTGALARFDGTSWDVAAPLNGEELPAVAMAIAENGDLWAVIADVEAVVDLQTGAYGPDYQVHDWVLARFDGTTWTTYQEPKEFSAGLPGLLESHGNTIYLSEGGRFGAPDDFQGTVTFDGNAWNHTGIDR